MNQPLLKQESRPDPVDASSVAATGVGPALRQLREARRLSVGDVSARVKFSSRQIDALENERWDDLPRGVSLRGLVKNYGRFLDADVKALLTMLDNQVGSTVPRPAVVQPGGTAEPSDLAIHTDPVHRPWGWVLVILILVFVVGFYAIERGWVPESWLVFDWLKSLRND